MAYQVLKIGEEEIRMTDKEILFVNYYLSDANRNGTQAAIRAGYSEKTAKTIAKENITKPHIQKYIQYKNGEILEAIGIEQIRIAQEYAKLAFSDITDFMEGDYNLKDLDSLDKRKTPVIAHAKVQEKEYIKEDGSSTIIRTKEIKLHDKLKALDKLAEMAGLTRKEDDPGKDQLKQGNIFTQINNYYKS
jgi:phage terminase small subunit